MKKLILCIGTLGVAACGGGGGGHHGSTVASVMDDNVRIAQVSDDVMASNRAVTNMSSEVLIAKGGKPDTIARSASGTVVFDGQDYKSYRLNDVDFETDDAHDDDMKFVLDKDGRIVGLNIGGDVYNRLSNSNLFESSAGTKVEYVGLGKQVAGDGLHYSDFGTVVFNPPTAGVVANNSYNIVFAGGYDATEIDKERFTQDMTFNGVATGYAGDVTLSDQNAKLTFNGATGDETFTASFDNWYDVSVTRDMSDMVTFDLKGDNKNATGMASLNKPTVLKDETQGNTEGIKFSTEYYGSPVTNTASEATALINYYQGVSSDRTNVSIGFGGVAQ